LTFLLLLSMPIVVSALSREEEEGWMGRTAIPGKE
jgi:hypothetical protein